MSSLPVDRFLRSKQNVESELKRKFALAWCQQIFASRQLKGE